MDFGAYTESSVTLMVDLANTYDVCADPPEKLDGVPALERFLDAHGLRGEHRLTARDLDEVRTLRGRVRDVVEAPAESVRLERLNALLADAGAQPRVVSRDGGLAVAFTCEDASPTRRLAAEAGIGLATVLVANAERLKVCSAAPCRDVYVDHSKNRCRRYCSDTCGSRATVAAYRQRRRENATS